MNVNSVGNKFTYLQSLIDKYFFEDIFDKWLMYTWSWWGRKFNFSKLYETTCKPNISTILVAIYKSPKKKKKKKTVATNVSYHDCDPASVTIDPRSSNFKPQGIIRLVQVSGSSNVCELVTLTPNKGKNENEAE